MGQDVTKSQILVKRKQTTATGSFERAKRRFAWILLLPTLFVLVVVALYPLSQTFYQSLTNARLASARSVEFVGLDNYVQLFGDQTFRNSILVTIQFTLITVGFEFLLGLGIALIINSNFKGRGMMRAAMLVPWAIPTVISAQMWKFMFQGQGVLNDLVVNKLGIVGRPISWLTEIPIVSVAAVDIWKTTPFVALLLLAGLQVIPLDIYEAARVDGANKIQQFFSLTLPLLRPAILVTLIFRTLDALRVFDVFFAFFENGRTTQTMAIYNQQQLVSFSKLGYGGAVSVAIFLIIALFVVIYVTFLKVEEAYSMNRTFTQWLGRIGFYLLIGVVLIYTLFPFYWAFVSSLKSSNDLFATPVQWWPANPTLANYELVLSNDNFRSALLQSTIVALSVMLLALAIGSLAAYALGRIRFRGRSVVLYLVLAMTMFPQIAVLGALFDLVNRLNLDNKLPTLVITYMIFTLPFTVWVLTNFFKAMPAELEEAAYVDGATPFQTFTQVFMPLAAPGMVTTGLLAFIAAWNEFLYALSFMITPDKFTVPVAITKFSGAGGNSREVPWGQIMAASVLVTIPLIVLTLIFQRRILAGLTAGAVKG